MRHYFRVGSIFLPHPSKFKEPLRQLQRKRHIKIELCVRLSALRCYHVGHVYKIGEVSFHLIGTNGFHVRGKE